MAVYAALQYSVSLCTMDRKTKANYIIILLWSLYSLIQFSKDQNMLFSLGKISWHTTVLLVEVKIRNALLVLIAEQL